MAISATTKLANRYGLNLTFHNVADGSSTTNDFTIDFANEVSVEITGDAVYATGGQGHKRLVGFQNPLEGTLTISTQITSKKLLELITGSTDSSGFTFKTDTNSPVYKITGETVRKDPDGTTYDETITVYKAMVRRNFSASYTGDGDPQSIDVVFDLFEDDTNGMIKIGYADQTSG